MSGLFGFLLGLFIMAMAPALFLVWFSLPWPLMLIVAVGVGWGLYGLSKHMRAPRRRGGIPDWPEA